MTTREDNMKINSISIINYRSIAMVKELPLNDYSVILGKNNEGKTNILSAISLGIASLKMKAALMDATLRKISFPSEWRRERDNLYQYERDYPMALQSQKNNNPTVLVLDILFNEKERRDFIQQVGIKNDGRISVEITYKNGSGYGNFTIAILKKRGKGATSYKSKLNEIITFIAQNINFQYIPAVRTENRSLSLLRDLVSDELAHINDNEYNDALKVVQDKQKELMSKLSEQISEKIKVFLPSVKRADIILNDDIKRSFIRSDIDFIVDDGTKTNLSYKGEGIKSLITLALLNSTSNSDTSRIVAIEEPESHLHPGAIHQIHSVIQSISETNQVIITTHNGVFVNRLDLSSNIIIDNGVGNLASSIEDVRKLLGIQLADNLICTDTVIIVEGSDDVMSLKSVLSQISGKIRDAIKNKKLSFVDLGGASKLTYKCSLYASLMCKYYVIVDGDKSGVQAKTVAIQNGLLSDKDVFILYAYGDNRESEFEDFLCKELYQKMILSDYGVDINVASFRGCKKKWSDRLKDTFLKQGKEFNDKTEEEIKRKISKLVERSQISVIFPTCYLESMRCIAMQIERLL